MIRFRVDVTMFDTNTDVKNYWQQRRVTAERNELADALATVQTLARQEFGLGESAAAPAAAKGAPDNGAVRLAGLIVDAIRELRFVGNYFRLTGKTAEKVDYGRRLARLGGALDESVSNTISEWEMVEHNEANLSAFKEALNRVR